jgi:hypothetical protein
MGFKIVSRKVYDDGSFGTWSRWSSKVYNDILYADQALTCLYNNNYHWGFDFNEAKMWKYEFLIKEHTPQSYTSK